MVSALLISGNLRTFENCSNSFKKLIDKFNCDVFICVSNKQFSLHPYIMDKYNMTYENNLNEEMINEKFNTIPEFKKNIKKIILINDDELDVQIMNNYISNFDDKKGWKGIDIFKQFKKKQQVIDCVKKYQLENKLNYDYIIQTRFDIDINIDTLPGIITDENIVYSTVENMNPPINDHIFVTNDLKTLETITKRVLKFFFYNSMDNETNKNINTILKSIFIENKYINKQTIHTVINRDYNNCFNTSITLVTCFYNIKRDTWEHNARSIDRYFINCKQIMNKRNPIVIFTTEEFNEKIKKIRQNTDKFMIYTKIINIPFEKLKFYEMIEKISIIQKKNVGNISPQCENINPEFQVPEYVILINNKINFLQHIANINPYFSDFFQWSDFGIHPNMFDLKKINFDENYFNKIFFKKNKIKLVGFKKICPVINRNDFYNKHMQTTCATLFGGDKTAITKFNQIHNEEFLSMIEDGLCNQEQFIYYMNLCHNSSLFDYNITNSWNELCKIYSNNSVNIALCMSGHMRSYEICRKNIIDNIISPLQKYGFNVDMFLSSWSDIGFREDNMSSCDLIDNYKYDFKKINIEQNNRNFFINTYKSDEWQKYKNLSNEFTFPDAISMLYKINDSFDVMIKYSRDNNINYDIIIRIRPDIIYDLPLNINCIKDCLLNDSVYMPFSHGKYQQVTKNIMDHFFFGNYDTMKYIMETYKNHHEIINFEFPHTDEGLIYGTIMTHKIKIRRFLFFYSVIRKNGIKNTIFK